MLVFERVSCNVMIKAVLFEDDHFVTAPFMVIMALDACACIAGMGTLPAANPFSQLLMAVKTFAVRDAAAQGVTFGATLYRVIFGMSGCQLPWTYQRAYPILGHG